MLNEGLGMVLLAIHQDENNIGVLGMGLWPIFCFRSTE